MTVALLLQILALVCLTVAAAGVPSKVRLDCAGLALWLLATMVRI